MQVILQTDVDNLGEKNDVVTVADGYARNFLIPRGMARHATPGALRDLEYVKVVDARKEIRHREQAEKIAEEICDKTFRIEVKAGPGGRLYGSVTASDIADLMRDQAHVDVDRRKVKISEPIRVVGDHRVEVTIFKGVTVTLGLEVAPEGGELLDEHPDDELAEQEENGRRVRSQFTDTNLADEPQASPEPDSDSDETEPEMPADDEETAETEGEADSGTE